MSPTSKKEELPPKKMFSPKKMVEFLFLVKPSDDFDFTIRKVFCAQISFQTFSNVKNALAYSNGFVDENQSEKKSFFYLSFTTQQFNIQLGSELAKNARV